MSKPAFVGKYNASDYTTHADLLTQAGKKDEALATLEAGLKAFPDNGAICYTLSDYWFDQKDYAKSADYVEKYINSQENPKRSELYSAALSFLGAASSAGDNASASRDYANRGIALMDRAMDGLEVSDTPVQYLRRKALLSLVGNNNIADEKVADAYQKVITKLDTDSENANPANPKNNLQYYTEAYLYISQYYANQQDAEKNAAAKEKYNYYQALYKQVAK
jgi:hypothetical protein